MKRRISARMKDNTYGWLLLLPVVLCIIIVKWSPIISGIARSFYETKGYEITEFVEWKNYKDVLSDTLFLSTLKNTLMYVFWSLVIGFIPPLSKPILATISVFVITASWNSFMWPFLMLTDKGTYPVSLALYKLQGELPSPKILMFSILMVIPMIVVYFISQRFVVRNSVNEGEKG